MNNTGALRFFISLLWTLIIPIALSQHTNDFASSMQMLQLVNNARIQKNIRPLCLSEKLVRAAMAHSTYQASINTMTHDGPVSLGDRFIRQGYQPSAVAENVGFTSTPFTQVVFDIWMSSPEHRANILDPNYVHFGTASSHGTNNMYFWTQLFAKPMNLALEPCNFAAAATAAALTPSQAGFNPNGAWGPSNYNTYHPSMIPNGNCITIENGQGGKSLSCKLGGGPNPALGPNPLVGPNPALRPNPALGPNPFIGPNPAINPITSPLGPNVINNPPGYPGASCTVVSTTPADDGLGSVRVLRCKSKSKFNSPRVGLHRHINRIGDPVIINPEGGFADSGFNNPPGYNPPGFNPALRNPPGYNPPGFNPTLGNSPGHNPPGFNPALGNPPGFDPALGDPPGHNPPGFNPALGNPPGYNPPGYNPASFWN